MTAPLTKPLPQVSAEMAPFFDAARRHQLVVQRCGTCHTPRFPARAVCSRCLSRDAEWAPVSGRGRIFSVAVMHQSAHPAFEVPYAVVIVELEEGPRMLSNVVECPTAEIAIDMPVEVVFEDVTPDVTLPKFRPRR